MASSTPTYGGQAVIEGVMIRGQRHASIAVRRPDGTLAMKCEPLGQLYTGRLRRVPVLRGVLVLAETLSLGMRALMYSANVGAEAEGQEIGKGQMAATLAFSMVFAIGIFFLLPVLASRLVEGPLGSDLLSNLVEGLIRLGLFVGYIVLIGRMDEIRRVFMYHGAEHMTVHAQENGDPPGHGVDSTVPDCTSQVRHCLPANGHGRSDRRIHLHWTRSAVVAGPLPNSARPSSRCRKLRADTVQRVPLFQPIW